MNTHVRHIITLILMLTAALGASAQEEIICAEVEEVEVPVLPGVTPNFSLEQVKIDHTLPPEKPLLSIYAFPMSHFTRHEDWHRMWVNTAVLSGAFVGTLLVLECLPADATDWNKKEFTTVPMFRRWYNHVIKGGPVWDHDLPIINFFLHPYSGAAYFMSARSCGFNFWGSLLYSTLISTVEWEFGIEAFMERPSYNDLILTPVIGSIIGEGFYMAKHHIVNNGYRLLGSPVLGNIVAFLIDPVNEVVGLFAGNPARRWAKERGAVLSSAPGPIYTADGGHGYGLTVSITF